MTKQNSYEKPWIHLYRLLVNDQGIRLRLRIPDTVLFEGGIPVLWLYNDKAGVVRAHPPTQLKWAAIVKAFCEAAPEEHRVAIRRAEDGSPDVLTRAELEGLALATRGQAAGPTSLQQHVQPLADLRFIATYNNDGTCTSCHTHQRHRRTVQTLAEYLARAHGASLRSLVCEFVREASGALCLIGVLRADWVSSRTGAGGEPWSVAAFQAVAPEASWVGGPEVSALGAAAPGAAALAGAAALESAAGTQAGAAATSVTRSRAPAGHLPYAMVKGGALLTSHLTRQLVGAADALALKSELIDKLEREILAIQHDKHIITQAFDRLSADLTSQNATLHARLEALERQNAELSAGLEVSRLEGSAAAAARDELREQLDQERDETLDALRKAQHAQREAQEAAEAARREAARLRATLGEERLSFEALKKQAVVQHTLLQSAGLGPPLRVPGAGDEGAGDGGVRAFDVAAAAARPEGRLWRTLEVMSPLLQTQQDPTGERYALTQLLHSWLPDLHATFLNYCLFEPDYAHQWPPALGTTGWSAFLTESKALGDGEGWPAPDPHALFARAAAGWRPAPPSSFCALLLHLAEACLPARPEDPGSPSFSERARKFLGTLLPKAGKMPAKVLAPPVKPKAKLGGGGRGRRVAGRGRL
ncbi:hypothetical protein QBZ16_004164 [Prototheca wickerhamii]|uniref:Uncharacterized protein n=1 Tax=Prototheca wickerhamii TaxID=3111 RepID=A0AAD9IJD7_PROWI|nr:hypothetical protein QBZ16_004164 [Prototheca wickerhamii]